MPRKALGKGLRALIPEELEEGGQKVIQLAVSQIAPNPYQPRMEFDQGGVDELKRSILEKGVIQPIIVRHTAEGYQVIAGERKLLAVKQAGLETIPALVMDVSSPEEMMELALIENIQRENLNPIEEAKAYDTLSKRFQLTQEEISEKVGKDRSTIANLLRLLRLPDEIQKHILADQLSAGHARALLAIEDEQTQLKLCKKTIKDGLSVRRVEEMVRAVLNPPTRKAATEEKTPLMLSLEQKLQELLETKVRISKKQGKGKIEILFHSDDDLERMAKLLWAKIMPDE